MDDLDDLLELERTLNEDRGVEDINCCKAVRVLLLHPWLTCTSVEQMLMIRSDTFKKSIRILLFQVITSQGLQSSYVR